MERRSKRVRCVMGKQNQEIGWSNGGVEGIQIWRSLHVQNIKSSQSEGERTVTAAHRANDVTVRTRMNPATEKKEIGNFETAFPLKKVSACFSRRLLSRRKKKEIPCLFKITHYGEGRGFKDAGRKQLA